MRSDRYVKALLTIIAIGLWALTLTQFAPPEAQAGTSPLIQDSQARPEPPSTGPHAPTVTDMPLRWRIARARLETGGFNTYCGTEVVVTNITGSTVNAKVEWMDHLGASLGVETLNLTAYEPDNVAANITVEPGELFVAANSGLSDFQGYALVYADDPRVMATARIYCRDATGIAANIVSDQTIPAYPVGTTADFFQAGMPMSWTPPMAEPESPE
jgi:hypothetical protein